MRGRRSRLTLRNGNGLLASPKIPPRGADLGEIIKPSTAVPVSADSDKTPGPVAWTVLVDDLRRLKWIAFSSFFGVEETVRCSSARTNLQRMCQSLWFRQNKGLLVLNLLGGDRTRSHSVANRASIRRDPLQPARNITGEIQVNYHPFAWYIANTLVHVLVSHHSMLVRSRWPQAS